LTAGNRLSTLNFEWSSAMYITPTQVHSSLSRPRNPCGSNGRVSLCLYKLLPSYPKTLLSDLIANLRVPEKEPVEAHPGPNLSCTNSNGNFDLLYSLFDLYLLSSGTSASASAVVQPAPLRSRHASSELNTPEPYPTFSVTSLIPSLAFVSAQYQSRRPLFRWGSELRFQAAARLHIPLTSTTQKLSS
jgi:hypothetical protein